MGRQAMERRAMGRRAMERRTAQHGTTKPRREARRPLPWDPVRQTRHDRRRFVDRGTGDGPLTQVVVAGPREGGAGPQSESATLVRSDQGRRTVDRRSIRWGMFSRGSRRTRALQCTMPLRPS